MPARPMSEAPPSTESARRAGVASAIWARVITRSIAFGSTLSATTAIPGVSASAAVPRRAECPPDLLGHLGERIGERYDLAGYINRGGFGEVWQAIDCITGERVAIKLMLADTESTRALVSDEVTALRWAELPGIVRLRDDGIDGNRAFIVSDLISGDAFPGATVPDLSGTTARLLEILGRLHSIGVVHGDLKPSNILVDDHGHPTVLDLGIARGRALRPAPGPARFGTPGYSAPELDDGPPSPRSDLYSVGFMLQEVARRGRVRVAAPLRRLARWLTQRDPSRRPASAGHALALLGAPSRLDEVPGLPEGEIAGPGDLEVLFLGIEPFLHQRSRAAFALWQRTGGHRVAVVRELTAWLRAGLAYREGEGLVVRLVALSRLLSGYPVAVGSADPPVSSRARDLLVWIRLAVPHARPGLVAAVCGLAPSEYAEALAELRDNGLVWWAEPDLLGARLVSEPAPHWSAGALRAAHASLARRLPPTSAARIYHRVAASPEDAGLTGQIVAAGRAALDDGRVDEAEAMIRLGLDLARLREDPDAEAALLPTSALAALASETRDACSRARYLIGRAQRMTPLLHQLDQLLAAVLARGLTPAQDAVDVVAPFADPALERWRQVARLRLARARGVEAEATALAGLERWMAAAPGVRRPDYLGWLGQLRYRQGRYAEAAACFADAARLRSSRTGRLGAAVNEASVLLEGFDLEAARARAGALAREAHALHHPRIEATAVYIERTARYRQARRLRPRPALVEAAAALTPALEAMLATIEAAIAWRRGEVVLARTLARRGADAYIDAKRPDVAALLRALAIHLGDVPRGGELSALIEDAPRMAQADFGLQILGLLAVYAPPQRLAVEARALASRGRSPAQWSVRLDLMSYDEALRACGASPDGSEE